MYFLKTYFCQMLYILNPIEVQVLYPPALQTKILYACTLQWHSRILVLPKKKLNIEVGGKIWKSFWEPILRLPVIQWVVAILMAVAIWFVYFTCFKKIKGYEIFKQYRKKPAVFIFWHGRSMMLSPIICIGGMRGYAIASRHKDGRMMAKLQRLFGLRSIYGSTSEGGISVLREGVRILRDGRYNLCLSPDGPGGPSLRIQDGALYFAKMTGAEHLNGVHALCIGPQTADQAKKYGMEVKIAAASTIDALVDSALSLGRD